MLFPFYPMLCRYADMAKSMDNINDTMIPDTFSCL